MENTVIPTYWLIFLISLVCICLWASMVIWLVLWCYHPRMVLSGVVAQFLHLHDDDDMNSTTAGKLFGQFLLHTSALYRRLVRKGILFVSQSLLYSKALQLFNMHGKMWTQVGETLCHDLSSENLEWVSSVPEARKETNQPTHFQIMANIHWILTQQAYQAFIGSRTVIKWVSQIVIGWTRAITETPGSDVTDTV